MITVKELAKMCDVSPSTISNILNGKTNVSEQTRERVMAKVRETGYRPNYFASSMRKINTKVISIIAEDMKQFSTVPMIEHAMSACEAAGYRNVLMNLRLYDRWENTWFDDDEKLKSVMNPALQEASSIKADGIIYIAGHCRTIKCFPKEWDIPMVVAYASSEDNRFPTVLIDDERGAYDMINYLLSLGHKDIGIIAGERGNAHTIKRLDGVRKACGESNIFYNEDFIVYGDWARESGFLCTKQLLDKGLKTIWCMNDLMAAGVYDYAYENNLTIGKDIFVAGFDNREISEFMYPPLTTMEIPLREIGTASAEMLISMLDDSECEKMPDSTKLPCKIITRSSVNDK